MYQRFAALQGCLLVGGLRNLNFVQYSRSAGTAQARCCWMLGRALDIFRACSRMEVYRPALARRGHLTWF